jgi:hypothetical protein
MAFARMIVVTYERMPEGLGSSRPTLEVGLG